MQPLLRVEFIFDKLELGFQKTKIHPLTRKTEDLPHEKPQILPRIFLVYRYLVPDLWGYEGSMEDLKEIFMEWFGSLTEQERQDFLAELDLRVVSEV